MSSVIATSHDRSMEPVSPPLVTGNTFDKYRSGNPIHRALVRGFIHSAQDMLSSIEPLDAMLEVGCGPGDLAAALFGPDGREGYIGTDISREEIALAEKQHPHFAFQEASAYALPFADGSFDCVIACEVLEHLEDPHKALQEIARVTRTYALLSVPREPLWRMLNVLRGAYLRDLGNTPGHLQHWSKRRFLSDVRRHFDIVDVCFPLPWMMVVGEKR
jgi:SAM-dependent methyltransferase